MRPASLGRRAAAGVIDLALLGGLAMGGIGSLVAVASRRDAGGGHPSPERARALIERLAQPRVRLALQAAGLGLAVALRNSRSPGMRALGLRRADARSGGPVTVRAAVLSHGINELVRELGRRPSSTGGSAREACLRALPSLVISLGPAALGPDHRTLASRVAGVIVVTDR